MRKTLLRNHHRWIKNQRYHIRDHQLYIPDPGHMQTSSPSDFALKFNGQKLIKHFIIKLSSHINSKVEERVYHTVEEKCPSFFIKSSSFSLTCRDDSKYLSLI